MPTPTMELQFNDDALRQAGTAYLFKHPKKETGFFKFPSFHTRQDQATALIALQTELEESNISLRYVAARILTLLPPNSSLFSYLYGQIKNKAEITPPVNTVSLQLPDDETRGRHAAERLAQQFFDKLENRTKQLIDQFISRINNNAFNIDIPTHAQELAELR